MTTMSAFSQRQSASGCRPPVSRLDSVDLFVTYRCGLRCSHCFVGAHLDLKLDMEFGVLARLVGCAQQQWGTRELTFLGGEPTLYPNIIEALELATRSGYRTRIVTNGQASYLARLEQFASLRPFICFSIDGSCAAVHDNIRGSGSFDHLIRSVNRTKEMGHRTAGISSISRNNAPDVARLVLLCDSLEFEYLNIHYVTNRGFAGSEDVLSIDEWERVVAIILEASRRVKMEVRVERTFAPAHGSAVKCAVVEKSNLMFLPDGRVFRCMLFIDVPGAHSFTLTASGLQVNSAGTSEQQLALTSPAPGCPAMSYVNSEIACAAAERNLVVTCIYAKERFRSGEILSHRAEAGQERWPSRPEVGWLTRR